MTASSNPFCGGSWGWCTLVHQNNAAGEENGSIMMGMFVLQIRHRLTLSTLGSLFSSTPTPYLGAALENCPVRKQKMNLRSMCIKYAQGGWGWN